MTDVPRANPPLDDGVDSRQSCVRLQQPKMPWEGSDPLIAQVKFLKWSAAGGLCHATVITDSVEMMAG